MCLILLLFLPSCGYHFGRGEIADKYATVCVPYVEGDNLGVLTSSIIRTISSKGALKVVSSGADLVLRVILLPPGDENIGFVYAPPDIGDHYYKKNVVANAARLELVANVTLIDQCTQTCIFGPLCLKSFLDYDFEPDLSNVDQNSFSLGQLEMHNPAQDAAFLPACELLAEKIVDYLNNSW